MNTHNASTLSQKYRCFGAYWDSKNPHQNKSGINCGSFRNSVFNLQQYKATHFGMQRYYFLVRKCCQIFSIWKRPPTQCLWYFHSSSTLSSVILSPVQSGINVSSHLMLLQSTHVQPLLSSLYVLYLNNISSLFQRYLKII